MEKIKYYVNEEKRTVICVIRDTECRLADFIRSNAIFNPVYQLTTYSGREDALRKLRKMLYLPNQFVGKATCSPDDEWNEETGRYIAYARAKEKYDKCFFKHAQKYFDQLDLEFNNFADRINKYGAILSKNLERRDKKVQELIGK